MSVSLTSNFLKNARGFTLGDANGVTWAVNKATNTITASVSGAAGGTVTSVGLTDGSATPIYTTSGSPVTTAGNLAFALKTQNANLVFAGPASGAAAQPGFRALAFADVPSGLNLNTQSGTTYTLVLADASYSSAVFCNGAGNQTVTVPGSIFSAGELVTIIGWAGSFGASTVTIAAGVGVTLHFGNGTNTTGNRTLTTPGVAYILFINATTAIVYGFGVT